VDTVANNLANLDTLGFKKDQPTFREYLSVQEREADPKEAPRGPVKQKELYPLEGKDTAFVTVDGTYTNFRQGNLRVTQSPLDLALDGQGFLEVSTPQGVRYTRHGSLKLAQDGRLVTSEGYPVLAAQPGGLASTQQGQGGPETQGGVSAGQGTNPAEDPGIVGRFINLRDRGGPVSISETGELYVGDQRIAKLSVVEFADRNKLRKAGGSLFENKDQANLQDPQHTVVRQGVLETSNVNPVEEMANMIRANRMFEQDMKALKTYGDLMGREVNDIGKL
jgi:flagellar basal-body rod protein FlgF